MVVTKEETEKYKAFVIEQLATLKSLEIDPEEVIWHYTTGTALLNIIETGTLYSTQVSCLNDSTELSYASGLLHEAALQIGAGDLPEKEGLAIEQFMKAQADGRLTPAASPGAKTESSWWFVTCFSKERDDLSQWRAYGAGENGYAIGFRVGGLFKAGQVVVRVNYDQNQHKVVAGKVATASLRFFMEGLENGRHESLVDWANVFFPDWENLVGALSPMVKNPAFRGENEFRIIHQLQVAELAKVRFCQKASLMARHLPLSFPPPADPDSKMLPIVEVIVGPSRHMEVSAVSVSTLMHQKGYNVPVTNSSIPFQMT
jgi:hypothetical protein